MAKIVCNFYSRVLLRATDITVIIPTLTCPESLGKDVPSHEIKEKFPVIYLLHGFGNNHVQWTGYTNVEMFAEERRIAVVNLSAENKFYSKVGMDDFFTFVSEELPEFVTNMFPVSSKPEDTYIAGLSMGGYGTYLHGMSHPERYHAMGVFSMGNTTSSKRIKNTEQRKDLLKLAKETISEGKTLPKMYVACGTNDFLFDNAKKFAKQLKRLGADVTWEELEGYGHEWRFWNIEIEKFMDWIPREDYYAKLGRRPV